MGPHSQPDFNKCPRSRQIAEEARGRLRNDPHVNRRNVSCECEEGVLRLQGELPTFYAKQLAQEAVRGIKGVEGIINEIEVNGG
jgi:osmotically-inducible protein OsmY